MSDKKHIDRLFQEKFKDFNTKPKDEVWNRISASLPEKKKKRRILPIWWQLGGVAAVIVLILTIGGSLFDYDKELRTVPVVESKSNDTSTEPENTIPDNEYDASDLKTHIKGQNGFANANSDTLNNTDKLAQDKHQKKPHTAISSVSSTETKTKDREETQSSSREVQQDLFKKASPHKKDAVAAVIHKKDRASEGKENIKTKKDIQIVLSESTKDNSSALSDKSYSKLKDKTENAAEEKAVIPSLSIEEAIAEQTTIEKEKADGQNRWSISPNVAPVYFSSLGQGSPINAQFNTNTKGSDVNMSYGINGSYAISKRLKLRAGINRVNLNQTTTDVLAFENIEGPAAGLLAKMPNVDYNNSAVSVAIMSVEVMNRNSTPELFNTKVTGNLEQQFGFIEVPMEIEYRLVDKKLGVNVIGGFSTLFLSNNEIYTDIDGQSTLIGEANNINSTSFSANFGVGMDYTLSKQWNINLEPMFKYQINTFNNTSGDFRPFFIGVYTGLSFKF